MFQRKRRQHLFLPQKFWIKQVTVIAFDKSGTVRDIKTYKGEEAKNIKPIDRKTETTGYETGVFREVFSNFGRISSKKPSNAN